MTDEKKDWRGCLTVLRLLATRRGDELTYTEAWLLQAAVIFGLPALLALFGLGSAVWWLVSHLRWVP